MSQRRSGAISVQPDDLAASARHATTAAPIPIAARGAFEAGPPGLREPLGIWALFGAVALIILIVYATHPAGVFYHYTGHGLPGALGRTVVFLNFPTGFVALALTGFAIARLEALHAAVSPSIRHLSEALAIVAVPLLLVAAYPGVVSQASLDMQPVNAVPAIGVALALIVTLIVWTTAGTGERMRWHRADTVRVAIIVALAILGLPWIMAELGVHIADVPLLDRWFTTQPGLHRPAGVHLGDHHGMDGILFVTAALILSRELPRIGTAWLRRTLAAYLGLMLVYGAANAVQDFWGEQLVVPGWTRHQMPSVLEPAITPAWGIMLAIGIAVAILLVIRVDRQVMRRATA